MNEKEQQPQPTDLNTRERMGTYGRAVLNAMGHEARGEHETEHGVGQGVERAEVERTIEGWPEAPKNIARQMLDKYGPPNETTPTTLFW